MPEYYEDEFVIKSRDGRRKLKFNLGITNLLDYFFELFPNGRKSELATKGDIIEQKSVEIQDWNTTGGEAGGILGRLKWNNADMTLDLGVSDGSVTLQLGQELHTPCRNFTGSTIPDFRVVRTTGQQGNRVTVALAQANSLANCETTYGITTQELVNNQIGMVTSYGLVNNVNTEAFTEGAVLYLSDTTAGMLTQTPPMTPSFRIPMAICVRSHQSNGKVLVSIHPSRSLNTLTGDTLISNPTNGQVLKYDGTKWVNGNGGATYTKVSPTNTTVGGLASNTAIANLPLEDIIEKMVVVYQSPTFNSFYFSDMNTSPVEVGTTFTGNKTAVWGTTNSGNILANTIKIQDVTSAGSPYLIQNIANDFTEIVNIGTIQKTTVANHTWRIHGTNTNNIVFTRDVSIYWQWKRFYGTSTNTTLDEPQIEAMTGQLASGFSGTYSLVAGGYKYFAWPDSFGSPTAVTGFKDTATNLAVAMADSSDGYILVQNGWNYKTVSVTNVNNVQTNYRLYRTKNILGGSINIQVS